MRLLLPVVVALWGLLPDSSRPARLEEPSCTAVLPTQVRVLDCRLAAAAAEALERSPTLRHQFDRIAALQGIVYVTTARYVSVTRKQQRGGLSHEVGASGPLCVLRVSLVAGGGDRAIGTLAHELHHAIEVLEHPEARSEQTIGALFARIGTIVGYGTYETDGAIATQKGVLRELREWRSRGR